MNLNKTSDKLINKKSKEVVPTAVCLFGVFFIREMPYENYSCFWFVCYQDDSTMLGQQKISG